MLKLDKTPNSIPPPQLTDTKPKHKEVQRLALVTQLFSASNQPRDSSIPSRFSRTFKTVYARAHTAYTHVENNY